MDPSPPRKNGASHVYSKLKHLLVNYKFKPCTPLHPAKLANRLRVSNTPVREALHRLAGENLLMSIPNKGFYTKVLALNEMNELYVLGNVLLQHAIAAGCAPPDGEPALLSSAGFAGLAQPDHVPAAAQFIEDAFDRIASLSRNHSLSIVIRNFNDRTHYVRVLDLELEERRTHLVRQTRSLVDHVRRHDTSEAIRDLQAQFQFSTACLPDLVKKGLARSYATGEPGGMSNDQPVGLP